jgi:DNA polymerase-3 subunit alpha
MSFLPISLKLLDNTNEIVAKIEDFDLERNPIMPEFNLPDGFTNEDEYLRHLTYEGAKKDTTI